MKSEAIIGLVLFTLVLMPLVGGFVACNQEEDEEEQDDSCNSALCKDPDSGLIWENSPPDETLSWEDAIAYCENLTLAGFDDWRLPTIDELRSLIRFCPATEPGGSCAVTESCAEWECLDDACETCSSSEDEFKPPGDDGCYWMIGILGTCDWYWSSTAISNMTASAWDIGFHVGDLDYNTTENYTWNRARCVRN